MAALPDPLAHRRADHDIETLFLRRWSPRAMNGEPLESATLLRLLEAARWAPSTYNEQEWRFLYARRDTGSFEPFLSLLVPGNRAWCERAGALVLVVARTTFVRNDKPNPVHLFDAGLAAQNLLLQGAALGLVVHAMAGYDRDAAREVLAIPDAFVPAAMIAVGHPGDPEALSESMRDKHLAPSQRKPLAEIACEGRFGF